MTRRLRIATCGVASDYFQSLVPQTISSLGYQIEWVTPRRADLLVFGPFFQRRGHSRWIPRPLRPLVDSLMQRLHSTHRPVTLFQTGENLRHDHIPCDYALSFDLAVADPKHYRLPYWMEMVDWSHEGITGNTNPRFGRLLDLGRLSHPLGSTFLSKPHRAALFASHLREPRTTLIQALRRHMDVTGFGPIFDQAVAHHSQSDFTKLEVLRDFAYNLCPENTMYPGYYTEKIPEAFMADSLPITWADSNVTVDFNPRALVNLAPMMATNFEQLATALSPSALRSYAEHPLLLRAPSILGLRQFLHTAIQDAIA